MMNEIKKVPNSTQSQLERALEGVIENEDVRRTPYVPEVGVYATKEALERALGIA
jgi:hypothetical protein